MSLTDVSTVTDSISIVLIDDHPIVRSGISTLMSLTNDLNVVGEAAHLHCLAVQLEDAEEEKAGDEGQESEAGYLSQHRDIGENGDVGDRDSAQYGAEPPPRR